MDREIPGFTDLETRVTVGRKVRELVLDADPIGLQELLGKLSAVAISFPDWQAASGHGG